MEPSRRRTNKTSTDDSVNTLPSPLIYRGGCFGSVVRLCSQRYNTVCPGSVSSAQGANVCTGAARVLPSLISINTRGIVSELRGESRDWKEAVYDEALRGWSGSSGSSVQRVPMNGGRPASL